MPGGGGRERGAGARPRAVPPPRGAGRSGAESAGEPRPAPRAPGSPGLRQRCPGGKGRSRARLCQGKAAARPWRAPAGAEPVLSDSHRDGPRSAGTRVLQPRTLSAFLVCLSFFIYKEVTRCPRREGKLRPELQRCGDAPLSTCPGAPGVRPAGSGAAAEPQWRWSSAVTKNLN